MLSRSRTVFNLYFIRWGGNTHLLLLAVLPITSPLICILFLFMWYWRLWMPPSPLCSFSSLCHVMTVRASKAAMVLISRDCDCEGDDWAVLLGSAKSLVLSWLIRRIPFLTLPYNLFFWIWMCADVECVCVFFFFMFFFFYFFAVILHFNFHGICVEHTASPNITKAPLEWIPTWCPEKLLLQFNVFLSDIDYIQTQAVFTHQHKYQSSQNAYLTTD